MLCDLLHSIAAGNKIVSGIYVRAVVARVHKRRRGNTHVYLPRACLVQKLYYARAGRAANDGIVYENDPLSAHHLGYGIELNFNLVLTALLTRSNKGSADILVFDKAYLIRYAGLL